jgi:DNA-binding MarR family transcriptional regulator
LNKKIFFSLIKIKRALRNTKIGAEFNVLGYIARHGHMGGGGQEPVTPSLIAKHFHMTTPMVAKTLRTLESKKYIHMTKDSHDGRKVNLSLTKSGELNFLRKLRIIHK